MIRVKLFPTICIAFSAIAASVAWAGDSPDDVLIANALTKLTRADYEAGLVRIPAEMREEFATSPRRLTMFLNNILISKTLAAQARLDGLQPEAGFPSDTPEEIERALAAAKLRAIDEAAGSDFDARRNTLVATARESYLLGRDNYQRPEQIRISAILISSEGRGNDAAQALARATRDKLLAWADFTALAKEISDDKATAAEGGHLPWASASQMDPVVAKAALALQRIGEISEPVPVGNSYLLIRLDEKRPAGQIPFDEVKESILAKLRSEYVNRQREFHVDAIRNDPAMKVDQEAVGALVRHIDPERFKPSAVAPTPAATPPK